MSYRFPLRHLLPGILLGYSLILVGIAYLQQGRAVDRAVVYRMDQQMSGLGNLMAGTLQDHILGGRSDLVRRELERQRILPELAMVLLLDADNRAAYTTHPALQNRPIADLPGAPPAILLQAARKTLSAQRWLTPDAIRLWGIYPVELPAQAGELRSSRYGLLLICLDSSAERSRAKLQLYQNLGLFVFGTALASLLLWGYLRKRVTRRVDQLSHAIQSFSEGGGKLPEPIEGQDEIALLANQFTRLSRNLQDSENLYRILSTYLPHRIFIKDRQSRYVACNENYARDLGIAREAIVGRRDTDFYPADLAERYVMEDRLVMEGGQARTVEEPYEVSGRRTWVRTTKTPLFDDQGQVTGLVSSFEDISEQKEAEERLRLAASVFENSQDGIVVTDTRQHIVAVNPAFTRVTGYTPAEVLGRGPGMLRSGRHDESFYQRMWQSINETGRWQGEIWNRRKNGEVYAELLNISAVMDDSGELTHYVGLFTDISDIKQTQQQLEQLAHYDALTELPNRTLLADRMKQAIARALRMEQLLAICFVDLDGFKPVNDQYGHATGDKLLVEVANRLKQAVRAGDTVARLGGDEFVLLLTDFTHMSEVEFVLNRLLADVATPYHLSGEDVRISASIGLTVFPLDSADQDTLLRHADQAMYLAKQSGRNRFHLFDFEKDLQTQIRRQEMDHIGKALANGEFQLYYQPKVNLRRGCVVGAEALIRWQDPERGLVPPGDFLPLIETSDMIVDVGQWVIESALAQMSSWRAAGLEMPVSVNIAGRHLQRPDFVERLRHLLERYPEVPPSWLDLEILESAALMDTRHVQQVIDECQHLGVRFSLDDFGTGYSSLSYLKQIPAHTLKIDRSFVMHILDNNEDIALVEGVVGLAAAFRREIIAEGMETDAHGLLLMRLGCDVAQGYGIARPMPADDLQPWLEAFRPSPEWALWADVPWEIADFPLLMAQHDHQQWVRRIIAHIDGKPLTLGEAELKDHHQCRFGRWYDGPGRDRYGHLPEYQKVAAIHEEVHRLGPQIVDLCRRREMEAARALMPQLLSCKDRILNTLDTLQRAIAGKLKQHT